MLINMSRRGLRNWVWFSRYRTAVLAPCYICGWLLSFDEATLDHVVPKSLGGKNELNNLEICCAKCNHKKADRLLKNNG